MKRLWALLLCAALLSGCAPRGAQTEDDGRLRIVTTLFPYYDFARAIAGEHASVTLLLSPGREAHSFEPTPLDAVTISRADVLVYNGGESETWVSQMLDAAGEHIGTVLCMMDCVDAQEEELVEGMQGGAGHHHHDEADAHDHDHADEAAHEDEDAHEHDHADAHEHEDADAHDHDSDEIEYDEHVWTSPANAVLLCEALCEGLCAADAAHAEDYRANCAAYVAQLRALDARFAALRARAARDLLVFADRMPLLYFCKAYDLRYRAAFHGCSTDTEPSLATLRFLIDKVTEEGIPVVYTVDLDSRRIAEAVAESTGAAIDTLYSLQTISRADFDAGETYLTLMERNYRALERGLT